jgi:beta-galactosidase
MRRAAAEAGLALHPLPEGLRLRRAGNRTFAFNYSTQTLELPNSIAGTIILGGRRLPPAGVTVLED